MPDSAHIRPKNPLWTRDELILGLDLYFRLSYGQMDGKNPEVQELSRLLTVLNKKRGFGRTRGSVSLKLANFKRFDPACKSTGMRGGGKLEQIIWDEYAADKPRLRKEAARLKNEIEGRTKVRIPDAGPSAPLRKYKPVEPRRKKAPPNPEPMIASLRELGYSTEMAVADIIDNSIFAQAETVKISFLWDGKHSRIVFADNGWGMMDDELFNAMHFGSQSPLIVRDSKDLGRFGQGLKTASLSQCRKLTVLSRRKGQDLCFWRWDLDVVSKEMDWILIGEADERDIEEAEKMENGTLVVWEDLDRIVEADSGGLSEDHFYKVAEKVKRHIEMVFHRYLETGKFKILFNGNPVKAWDPFLRGEKATQVGTDTTLKDGKIMVRPYILPHRSKLAKEVWQEHDMRGGWDSMQGFYIYRNQRLLLAADWFGLARKKGSYKLARIMIDLPNTVDQEWQIDVKKSRARPPLHLRQELKAIVKKTLAQAENVFHHRGKQIQRLLKDEFAFVWNEVVEGDRYFFRINREHPVVAAFFAKFPEDKKAIQKLLRLLEETVPGPGIIAKHQEYPDNMVKPFENGPNAEIIPLMKELISGWRKQGLDEAFIKNKLRLTEPFGDYPHLIETMKI